MTQDEMHLEIGRAFVERRELEQKIKCLENRLRTIGEACSTLAKNPAHGESIKRMEKASDPREDWSELERAHVRMAELNKLLRDSQPGS